MSKGFEEFRLCIWQNNQIEVKSEISTVFLGFIIMGSEVNVGGPVM